MVAAAAAAAAAVETEATTRSRLYRSRRELTFNSFSYYKYNTIRTTAHCCTVCVSR
jgi:hypothetical protein